LRLRLSKLEEICSRATELFLLTSRATESLQKIARDGWEQYRPVCEQKLAAACQYWTQTEGLIADVAAIDVDVDKSLLGKCRELLAVCDQWVASEEEILELNDLGAQTYVLAHEQHDLVWQKDFCNFEY
jgi:hypothetical protein